jgi:pimeloyl-ACP methyl ester carboxylesterase
MPAIDPDMIYLLGHSMGAKFAPRVAERTCGVSGLVMLAADALPMEQSAVRVTRYLAQLEGAGSSSRRLARQVKRQARVVTSRKLSSRTRPERLPFAYSGGWWLDVREYDAVGTATRLRIPKLLMQGGRDYQVTVNDDLALWSAGLGERDDVDICVLERDDHFFFPGDDLSTPAGYEAPQHVDAQVVEKITSWIHAAR